MSRRSSPLPTAILIAADVAALGLAFEGSSAIRMALNRWLTHELTRYLVEALFPPLWVVLASWGLALCVTGTYDLLGKRSLSQIAIQTARAVTLAMGLEIVLLFFFTRATYSRSLVLLFWALSLPLLTLSRQLLFHALRRLKSRGIGVAPCAVVGTGPTARTIGQRIAADREPRFRLVGYLADAQTTAEERAELGPQLLGHVDAAEQLINQHGLRRLFVASSDLETQEILGLVLMCDRMGVGLERVPDFLGVMAERLVMTELDGIPLLSYRPVQFGRWDETLKRTVDMAFASLGLLIAAPVLALIAAAIKLDTRGPILFVQQRVGRGGTYFRLLKFRSMFHAADAGRAALSVRNESSGPLFKIRDDPRVTRVGRVLRRFSIDELPQLFNVFAGQMSLVGPRPLPTEDIESPDPAYGYWISRRRVVRPGITGLWQVSGRSQLPVEEMINLDLHYIANWTLGLDLRILARTIPAVFRGHGAY